jgi:hypothetical protein
LPEGLHKAIRRIVGKYGRFLGASKVVLDAKHLVSPGVSQQFVPTTYVCPNYWGGIWLNLTMTYNSGLDDASKTNITKVLLILAIRSKVSSGKIFKNT